MNYDQAHLIKLKSNIHAWAMALGFQQVGIADIDLNQANDRLQEWLKKRFHGSMQYLTQNHDLRSHPNNLVPGTVRIISVRMNYLPKASNADECLKNPHRAYVSRYAVGRDYHKLIRKRLQKLADKINDHLSEFDFQYRAFADSAPVFEKPIAVKAGIGWQGKNTLVLNREAGSWFFLGELFINLPLPIDKPITDHCGSCVACLDICPTQAIVEPYVLDARRCISYLTIENKGTIPIEFRKAMGNRVFGCDDCQLVCPWNKFAKLTAEKDFQPRHQLDTASLLELFNWDEQTFLKNTEGSAIRRAGYLGWLRNLAVALGNAPSSAEIIAALNQRRDHPSELVREHVLWALNGHSV